VEVGVLAGVRTVRSTIELAGLNTEVRSVAVGATPDKLFLLVASRGEQEGAAAARLSTVVTDDAGNFTTRPVASAAQPVAIAAAQAGPAALQASHLATDPSGQPFTLTLSLNGALQLQKLSPNGTPERSQDIALQLPALLIRRFEAIGQQGFLIVGATGLQPLLVQIDASGRVLRKLQIQEETGAAVAAFPGPGEDMTVLVESANYVDPRFWVGRVRADGSIAGRAELAGRPLDLESGSDGRCAVLVALSGVAQQDIVAKGFDADFKLQWSRTVVAGQAAVGGFKLAALRDGGYLLAGKRDRGLWLGRVDANGKELWSSWTDPRQRQDLEVAVDVDLSSRGNDIAVAYTALVVRDRRQFGVVRTLQFKLD
jgi:hypothetical protein